MRFVRTHLPILILLQAIVFLFFGWTITAPLWKPLEFLVLYDAEMLSRDPLPMFSHIGTLTSQPLLQLIFLAEYKLFGLNPVGYKVVNLVIHGLNSFIVYMLVNMLFGRQRRMAVLSALLFAFLVGNYGKILLAIDNLEPLLLAHYYLLILYGMIRNDFRHEGRLRSFWFVWSLGLFILAGLTKAVTFSLLGCLLAYKVFFHKARSRRAILSSDLIVLIAAGGLFFLAKTLWGSRTPIGFDAGEDVLTYTWTSFKNLFRYLTLMVFPLQASPLISRANPVIGIVYELSPLIRWFTTLGIVSFTFFGIVFGSQAIRFFITWTFITVLPFTSGVSPSGWLNLKYLYLVSLGYCVVLAAGTIGCSRLLAEHRWRRHIPYAVPICLALMSLLLTYELDGQNRRRTDDPAIVEIRARLEAATREGDLPDVSVP